MSKENVTPNDGVNRAKMYQLALFPMNNGATNVYFVLILSYITYFGNGVLGIALMFASLMVTGMRVFDAITDPIIGALMDRTVTRFGKFRPFMVMGNAIMATSVIILYLFTPMIPETMMAARYVAYVLLYAVWVIGYTFQTSVTRSGQTVLTNDPKQRPLFTIFNTIASLVGMGAMQVMAPIIADMGYGYTTAGFYKIFTPVGIIVSIVLTILAIIGIAEKDQPKYFGIGGEQQEKIKISEYVALIKNNKPLQRLMVAGGGCKLALAVATNGAVLCMLYGCMMGDYGQFYLPMMVVGYVFSAPFFGLTVNTSQKLGQKASLQRYVTVALVAYIGVVILLALWQPNNAAFGLSLYTGELFKEGFAITINLYTILFILFFGIGYGAYYSTADMPIPMVADCSDYEMYSSGKYVPGIIGTLFSLVDKLVSSMASLVVTIALLTIGVKDLPDVDSPYVPGMNWVVIALFCIVPMVAWALTLWAMKGYELSGPRMKEIQAINAARKDLVAQGMTLEQAMEQIQTVEDIK
ncbi:MAG: MFS transporter [Agathobacter sp.]|nr:MFS transporter [Agathobacter sp.]MBQ3559797.1 MFS transporter [Agathobacter sp.]